MVSSAKCMFNQLYLFSQSYGYFSKWESVRKYFELNSLGTLEQITESDIEMWVCVSLSVYMYIYLYLFLRAFKKKYIYIHTYI